MNNIKPKIKLVFLPYLIISLTTVIGWTFLQWLLFIKFNVFKVNESVITIIVPAVLAIISIAIWLYKKTALLSMKRKGNLFFYVVVPFITMVGVSFFAQHYILLTTGKVTNLSSISEMEQKEPTKFYRLKNFYLDKKHFSLKKHFESSGPRHGNHLQMYLYITIPILNSAKDTLGLNCIGWYGVQYTGEVRGFMNNHNVKQTWSPGRLDITDVGLDTIEKSKEVKRFVNESITKFNNLNLNQFLYLIRISETEGDYDNFVSAIKNHQETYNRNLTGDYNNYISAIKNNTKYDTKSDLVLLPFNEPLAERANDNLMLALAVFGIGSLLFMIMVITPNLKSDTENISAL